MIGQLKLDAKGRSRTQQGSLYGLPVLQTWANPEGFFAERRLRKAGRSLRRGGALRTLAPADFTRWDLLEENGLVCVDPCPFLRALCAPLAVGALERQGLTPDRATVALRGLRADREMARAAQQLSVRVRRLVISAPKGGQELADWLRWEFGIPVLPQEEQGQVCVRFHPEGGGAEKSRLDLFGVRPDLGDLSLSAPGLAQEDQANLPILSVLWEEGRLGPDRLKIT